MTVRWTQTALADIEAVHAYVAEDSPAGAATTVARILKAIESLEHNPEIGRTGRAAGTRELVVAPFVTYRQTRGRLELLAIIHSARRWPECF